MRDAGHRTPDGAKSKNNISTPQGGGHNSVDCIVCFYSFEHLYHFLTYMIQISKNMVHENQDFQVKIISDIPHS